MNTQSKDIFVRACELDGEAREAFLEGACGDDAELRLEVQCLLAKAEKVDSFFANDESVTIAAESVSEAYAEEEGDQVGPYILRQKIGEGGFGVVWMAEQCKPISRMVALKVVKAGMDTKQVLARFEAERQALAMMDHPNIAKVFDAGSTSTGRPYFVMELVKGIAITEFCREQKLNTQEILALFQDVCSAINHAHQKGVIHRDLKPSNVMVTLAADKPVAKVIDFGIAKATQNKLTEKTLFTRFEQFLGTPVYMSPEQAAMSSLDIDTRSDIYSLGVLLYELLAGQPPFDPKTLLSAGYDEMRRIIKEDEPPKPSTRLTQTQTSSHTNPHITAKALNGELDWIVMKAIEKDRTRRYETANAFAADIGRYLDDEPVQAAAPSATYRFRKFARRNKAVFGLAATIALVLVAATAVSSWLALRATKAEQLAERRLVEAQFNEGLGWMLRAEVAEKEGERYPDTLLYAARAIGFDGLGRSDEEVDALPLLIRQNRNPDDYEKARQWIRDRANYLPVWSSGTPEKPSPVTSLTIGPLGRWLAVTAQEGSARVWDFSSTSRKETEIASPSGSPARDIAFHPEGKLLAVAREGSVGFWDLEKEAYADSYAASVSELAYSPSGRLLAGAAADGSILVWSDGVKKETLLRTEQTTPASRLIFSPDDSMLAAVFPRLAVKVFYYGTKRGDQEWLSSWEKWSEKHPREAAEVSTAAFSPNMSLLAIGFRNGSVSLWDMASAQLQGEVERHQRPSGKILDLGFRRDGKQLSSASADGSITLWTVDNDAHLTVAATLNGHGGEVTQVAYFPGGRFLACACADGSAMLWDISGRIGEEPDLYPYLREKWYAFDSQTQKLVWDAGKGFLNLPKDSVVGIWQRGEGANDRLFTRLIESEHWEAAALMVTGEKEFERREAFAVALLDDASAAAVDKHWKEVRLRHRQRNDLGLQATIGEEKIQAIEKSIPGIAGRNFSVGDGIEMVWCDKGTFLMGSPEDEKGRESDETQHEVTLTSGFWIGKYEVTDAQYHRFRGGNVSSDSSGRGNLPAVSVTWDRAIEYCRWLTALERVRGAIPPGWEYNLPTEAQWEYACRAGSTTAYSFGDDSKMLGHYAWHGTNSDDRPHPVGEKGANPWGVHDMHGNVHEWCWDKVGDYEGKPQTNPKGGERGSKRVFRGGCFNPDDADVECRSANRWSIRPVQAYTNVGFRLALMPIRGPLNVLVPPDSEWRWLHPLDGTDPATADPDFHTTFFLPGFDDASWQSDVDSASPGGGFGYGDPGGVHIGTPTEKLSAYFRHRFTAYKAHAKLELGCRRDDGIIVYLDGVEVARNNMAAGPEAYRLAAVEPIGGGEELDFQHIPLKGGLEPGEHVLAISLHNQNLTKPNTDLRIAGITLVEVSATAK